MRMLNRFRHGNGGRAGMAGWMIVCVAVAIGLSGWGTLGAWAGPLSEHQGEAILEELKAIHRLLQAQEDRMEARMRGGAKPPKNVTVALGDSPILGDTNAPITIVEFTDYQCPYCQRFAEQTFPELKKRYIDTGKVRFVSRNLPLPFHERARPAAQAAHCAREQERYWEFREMLFVNNEHLGPQDFMAYAERLGLNVERFEACVDRGIYREQIQQDLRDAQSIGATGTPTFVIGQTSDGEMNGMRIAGAQPFGAFAQHIEQFMARLER